MTKNEIKSKVQREALNTVFGNKTKRSLVTMATGAGKSKIGIDLAEWIANNKTEGTPKILIVVPTEKLRDENWKEEFEKWGQGFLWDTCIERCCYVSANKISGQTYDLVILDEAHNITASNSEFFYQNDIKQCLGLTATPPQDEEKKEILYDLNFKITYDLSLDLAVSLGLVSPYQVTVVQVPLNSKDKNVASGSKAKPFMQTEQAKYKYLSDTIQSTMYSASPSIKAGLKFKILARMRFIYGLRSKTDAAQYLLDKVIPQEQRTLIFAGGIAQADELCEHSFHSKSKKTDTSFDDFKAERLNRLSCVNSLNEGHNIPNLDNGLVVQLNSKALNLIQRIGRIVRYRDGHRAQIYIICAMGTQDEAWVAKAVAELGEENINHTTIEELKALYGEPITVKQEIS